MGNFFTIKINIEKEFSKELDFFTKDYSLSKVFNILLKELKKDKSLKFRILKNLEKEFPTSEKRIN
jgi:hypothetical protein